MSTLDNSRPTLIGKNLLSQEQILSFKSHPTIIKGGKDDYGSGGFPEVFNSFFFFFLFIYSFFLFFFFLILILWLFRTILLMLS